MVSALEAPDLGTWDVDHRVFLKRFEVVAAAKSGEEEMF